MKHIFIGLAVAVSAIFALLVAHAVPARAASADILSQGSVSTCSYENMGWVICPVLRATATAGDYAFTFVSQNFLKVELTFYDAKSGAAQAGAMVRNFANVLFALAFLVIIYSLITGQGVGNYNLKRLVPRFILAVIFVNFSYYICQAMVDISNVVGVTIQQLLVDVVAKNIGSSAMPLATEVGKYDTEPLSSITSGVISKPEVAWILLAPLSAVVISTAVLCAVLIVLLIVRKALIVALIFMAPLAFFAYLLPNTSDYFSKWLKLFAHTLLLFPVIAILIGTGQIVSASIIRAGSDSYKVDNDSIAIKSVGQGSATLYLVAAGAAVLPLAGTWYVFKAAMSGIDAAGARVSRNGLRRSSRERDEKAKKREQTAMELNKKSMMLRGINRLQQLNVAKDGESNASIFGRVGGAYRGRGKHQTKTPEQARFDSQVQQRLSELRTGSEGKSPQELYSQALQRYQEHLGDSSQGGLNINSYEGIDLKASEAYLLESLGKGGGGGAAGIAAVAAPQNTKEQDAQKEQEKKSAGISSLNRDGKSNGGGNGGGTQQQDPYRPPSTGGMTGASIAGMAAPPQGSVVVVQQVASAPGGETGATSPAQAANGTGFMARRPAQSNNETLAKSRAAKYVAEAQSAVDQSDDIFDMASAPKSSTDNTPQKR